MRTDAARFNRFCQRWQIRRCDLVAMYVLATGYTISLPMMLRAFVQGRSTAAIVAGRVRTVPVVAGVVKARAA